MGKRDCLVRRLPLCCGPIRAILCLNPFMHTCLAPLSSRLLRLSVTAGWLLLLTVTVPLSSYGTVRIWTGGANPNFNWSAGQNWGGTPPSAGDDLVFPVVTLRLKNTNDFSSRGFKSI